MFVGAGSNHALFCLSMLNKAMDKIFRPGSTVQLQVFSSDMCSLSRLSNAQSEDKRPGRCQIHSYNGVCGDAGHYCSTCNNLCSNGLCQYLCCCIQHWSYDLC